MPGPSAPGHHAPVVHAARPSCDRRRCKQRVAPSSPAAARHRPGHRTRRTPARVRGRSRARHLFPVHGSPRAVRAATPPSVAAARATSTNTPASYAQVQQSLANLQQAASAISAMRQLQQAAHAVVAGSVANGLNIGRPGARHRACGRRHRKPRDHLDGCANTPVQTGAAADTHGHGEADRGDRAAELEAPSTWARARRSRLTRVPAAPPSGSWVVLNRVSGDTASAILGTVDRAGPRADPERQRHPVRPQRRP